MLESLNLGLITRQIFGLLPLHDIIVCTMVSKLWKSIIQEQVFRESQEKTESKWLNGKFKVTNLDVAKHLQSLELAQLICQGHTHNVESKISIRTSHTVELASSHTLEKNIHCSHNVDFFLNKNTSN